MTTPILLNSCKYAATAAEARFRLDYPLVPARAVRVVALDRKADEVVRQVAESEWYNTSFYLLGDVDLPTDTKGIASGFVGDLEDVDVVVIVAGTDDGAEVASTIGRECSARGITTAGLVVTRSPVAHKAVVALRPVARILVHPGDQDDLHELLRAMRA